MLILTRSRNETIINDDIKITVISDRHSQVKLGIDAPDDVKIWREEIYTRMQNDLMADV